MDISARIPEQHKTIRKANGSDLNPTFNVEVQQGMKKQLQVVF
jgi:hypothetical protein